MWRLRFFRVLIPALLVMFVVALVFLLDAPEKVHVDGSAGEKKPV